MILLKIKNFIFVSSLIFYSGATLASPEMESCLKLRGKKTEVNTQCVTQNGSLWVRINWKNFGQAWKAPNNLIWNELTGVDELANAKDMCKMLGGHLPLMRDVRNGIDLEMDQVLDNPWRISWTEQGVEGFAGKFYVYDSFEKKSYIYDEFDSGTYIRCIAP